MNWAFVVFLDTGTNWYKELTQEAVVNLMISFMI